MNFIIVMINEIYDMAMAPQGLNLLMSFAFLDQPISAKAIYKLFFQKAKAIYEM